MCYIVCLGTSDSVRTVVLYFILRSVRLGKDNYVTSYVWERLSGYTRLFYIVYLGASDWVRTVVLYRMIESVLFLMFGASFWVRPVIF
jgi:hypothetical protein